MNRRVIYIITMAAWVATLAPTGSAQQRQDRTLLDARLSDEVSVTVRHTERFLSVTLSGIGEALGLKLPADPKVKMLSQIKTEVWVLRRDGTTVARAATPVLTPPELCSIGHCTASRVFNFESVPDDQVAGVVVSVDGKLSVREISH
jgi:hypothetical protein